MSAASCRIDFRRGTNATSTAPATTSTCSTCWTTWRSGTPAAWYWPQPQSENGESRSSWKPNVRSPKTRAAWSGSGSSRRMRKDGERRADEREREALRAREPPAVWVREPERREQQRGELRPAGERDRRAARPGGGGEPEAPDQERGHDRVVRVRVRGVERERVRRPRERERRAESWPAEAPPDEREPEQAERVEEERGRMRGPELVPLPGPAEDRVAGQVGQVRHRPVRVAARVRRLAAPVGLDPLADLPLRVGAAARLQAPLHRACARTASPRSRSAARRRRRRSRRR